ncbi:thioesterase family protein [Romboutsia sp.]|uniref:acyl-CoA thioesterase n=1 Tax=Romboutsia sp. TaxID=1965302 RepID=UPI002D1C5456|nr:thioesterase family protein [Romboutsia sp.]HSQ87804.1 thioesterase family protein [Romboutsia sp.]
MIIEMRFAVRYVETDKMGIAHHSNYAIWFEAGRTEFFKKIGIPYSKIEDDGVLLPLIDLKCSFKKPAMYEDEIIIKTKLENMTNVKVTFSYELYNSFNNNLIATGETTHAWTDKNLKPINIKKKLNKLYEILMSI